MTKNLEFIPITVQTYSNIGGTLLGQIIEVQNGLNFAIYIKTKMLEKMDIDESYVHIADYIYEANELYWNEKLSLHSKNQVVTPPVTSLMTV
jgi:CubicO group peptidase (beta-lactamase class C family)